MTNSQHDARRGGVAGLLAAFALVALPAISQPQPATPVEGRRIVEQNCARCHILQPGRGTGWADAPPFVEVAQDPKITRAWMRNFVTRLHMHMLNTDRSQAEADALTSYLLSLRRTR
jgi:mono/diheme cytochrome c family protein